MEINEEIYNELAETAFEAALEQIIKNNYFPPTFMIGNWFEGVCAIKTINERNTKTIVAEVKAIATKENSDYITFLSMSSIGLKDLPEDKSIYTLSFIVFESDGTSKMKLVPIKNNKLLKRLPWMNNSSPIQFSAWEET